MFLMLSQDPWHVFRNPSQDFFAPLSAFEYLAVIAEGVGNLLAMKHDLETLTELRTLRNHL